jgi:hypothetical protein
MRPRSSGLGSGWSSLKSRLPIQNLELPALEGLLVDSVLQAHRDDPLTFAHCLPKSRSGRITLGLALLRRCPRFGGRSRPLVGSATPWHSRSMADPIYVRTDIERELTEALRKVHGELEDVANDPYAWKWAVIALHNALQNAIVGSISGTANLGALTPNSAKKWLEVYRSGGTDYPEERMDAFPALYEKMRGERDFPENPEVDDDVRRLTRYRNDFIHFLRKGWSIEVRGFPRIFRNCLDVIEYLAWDPGGFFWSEDELRNHARTEIETVRRLLTELEDRYEITG